MIEVDINVQHSFELSFDAQSDLFVNANYGKCMFGKMKLYVDLK